MIESFPIEYDLESGTKVTVSKSGEKSYDFFLQPVNKPATQFTYVEDERKKSDWDEALEFEELEALRIFWLQNEDIV